MKPEGTLSFSFAWLSACPSACQTIYRSFFLSLSVFLIISVGSNLAYMMRYQQEKLPFCLFIPFNISLKSQTGCQYPQHRFLVCEFVGKGVDLD